MIKRFLISAGNNINLDQNGFLPDPEDKFGKYYNESIVSFEEIEDEPCIIILGEPGIGKTTLLKEESERLTNSEKKVLWVNFKDIYDNETIKEEIFEKEEVKNIAESSEKLYLFLDGLDESIISFEKLANKLVSELKKIPRENLHIRISGRTVNFPDFLINELQNLWNVENKCFEICPLRWLDVEDFAKNSAITDTDKFFETIRNLNLSGFVNKPITLETVVELYKADNLSGKQFDIYFTLCEKLASENNPYRIDLAKASHVKYEGNLSSLERLHLAGRIASCFIFSNKISIFDGAGGNIPDSSINIDDLCTGYEIINDKKLEVSKENIREAISTTLFTLINENSLGFSHRSYTEFLAAWYMNQKNIDLASLLSLITFPESNGEVIPQLYEVASWLASLNNEIFEKLSESDPEVLILSSVKDLNNKEKLVKKLFELIGTRKSSFSYASNVFKLEKLNYTGLDEYLKQYLRVKTESSENIDNSIKYLAVELTHVCKLESLEDEVYQLAINPLEEYKVRQIAFIALMSIAGSKLKSKLASGYDELIKDFEINDKDDCLKGYYLKIVWPDYINTEKVFRLILKPKDSGLWGGYQSFLSRDLIKGVLPPYN